MTDFTTLGLIQPVLKAVVNEGYTTPSPIQREAIPALLAGRDLVGIAQTGTGKTAAFLLPLLNRLGQEKAPLRPKTTRALILAPTRELAAQILQSIQTYGKNLRLSSMLVIGGVKPGPQAKGIARGCDIVVATPGRLLDHMNTGVIRLDETHTVILDEADQMMDLGFLPGIRRIMAKLPEKRQTALFSATMPKQIRALAQDFLNDPDEVRVSPPSTPVERIEQKVLLVEQSDKRKILTDLIKGSDAFRTIVFTRTKRGADRVTKHLQGENILAEAIHGDKSQGQRERALKAFKGEKINVLVATDIAARGIDIDGVDHVINFELPNVPEAYVHRIGRTARAGATGAATSLCDGTERGLLKDIERLIGRRLTDGGDAPGASDARQEPSRPLFAKAGEKRSGDKRKDAKPRRPQQHRAAGEGAEGELRAERPHQNRPHGQRPKGPGDRAPSGRPGERGAHRRTEHSRPVEAAKGDGLYSLSALMEEGERRTQRRKSRRRNKAAATA